MPTIQKPASEVKPGDKVVYADETLVVADVEWFLGHTGDIGFTNGQRSCMVSRGTLVPVAA